MAFDNIPRTHCFSLGDFHDFDSCIFRYYVNHHLQKKYQLAEGNVNQAIGTLLDLAIKKLHMAQSYKESPDSLLNLIDAARSDVENEVYLRGSNSFFGALPAFLTPEVIALAKNVFRDYLIKMDGKIKPVVPTKQMKKIKPFWSRLIQSEKAIKLWGGPDAIEMGSDGVPEVADYKYFENCEKGKSYLDMDLMPKMYFLLTADDLIESGFDKARFVARIWGEPNNNDFYEELDFAMVQNLEDFFKDKIERMLRNKELSFCEKEYCRACKSSEREEWVAELKVKGYID
ncbi:MAG: PD-(D/E)XK nuclease family protein [Candidatus Daviesbacteria bacterium]|nr:PD-(D/E)XK nuclease family protein [Candidatus Daviesbacteria bacterium]